MTPRTLIEAGNLFRRRGARRLRRMKPDEAAVYWIVLRDSRGLGQVEAAAFAAWLALDTNRQAYRQVLATWTALDGARV